MRDKKSLSYKLLRGSYAIAAAVMVVYLLIFNPRMLWALLAEVPLWVWIAFALFNLLLAYVWWAESRNPNWVKMPPISKTQLKKNKRQQQK